MAEKNKGDISITLAEAREALAAEGNQELTHRQLEVLTIIDHMKSGLRPHARGPLPSAGPSTSKPPESNPQG